MKVRFAVAPPTADFDPDGLIHFARSAEGAGLDTVWLSDVPLGPGGDPLVSLAFLAAETSTIKLGANVVPVGRNPLLLARQLAQIDRLSGGRLLLTFVPGLDQPGERRALGAPTGDRGALIEEVLVLLRRWWAGEAVEHVGAWHDVPAVRVDPTPVQDPLEVWLAGRGPKALQRVARCGDGWLTANMDPDEATRARQVIQRWADELGRVVDPEHFGISIGYARHGVPDEAVAALRTRRPDADPMTLIPAGAAGLRSLVQRHVDAGLSKFVLRPLDPGDVADDVGWLADVVLPLQS
jgi:probable F420-dependent oxidoreductase